MNAPAGTTTPVRQTIPLFGFPPVPPGRLRIAYWGDPWLGAMLARRHHVLWLRPEEARHVIELEQPDMLLVTPRAEATRALRAKPLVASDTGEIDPNLIDLVSTFRSASLPVVFHDLLARTELDRYLPAARLADVVMAGSPQAVEAYVAAGLTTARFHERGAFGSPSKEVPIIRERRLAHLQAFEMRSAKALRISDGLGRPSSFGMEAVDLSAEPVRADRVGLELVRRASWGERRSKSPAVLTLAGGVHQPLPSEAFDAVLEGTLTAVVGDDPNLTQMYPRWLPFFTSLEDAARASQGLSVEAHAAWLRPALAAVLESTLIDDWLEDALAAVGGALPAPGNWARDFHVVVDSHSSDGIARRIGSLGRVASVSERLPSSSQLAAQPVVRVKAPEAFDEEAVRLLLGWARYTSAPTVSLWDVQARLIATWHSDASTVPSDSDAPLEHDVLLTAEEGTP